MLTTVMLLWAFLNCYSRIYLGVHYPGDILAGVLVGFIAASFSYWVYIQLCKEHSVQKPIRFLWLPVGAWLLSVAALMCYALFVDF